ncbi:MAG: hypothetical protein MUF51_08085 [Vicinamibacteria bacterium]|jgi:Tfp pilus assembly protein PilO|nr:hypothetical protein [Vicinamibacteria bacterium]
MFAVRRAILITLAMLAAANIVVYFLLTEPRLEEERFLAHKAADLKKVVAGRENVVSQLKQRLARIDANRADTRRFYEEHLQPRGTALLTTEETLLSLANEAGMVPLQRGYAHEWLKQPAILRLSVTMPLSGSYSQLTAFLDAIEKTDAFIVLDSVRLQLRSERKIDIAIAFSAYFRPEQADGGRTK